MELISKEEVLKVLDKLIERKTNDLVTHAMLCGLGEEINELRTVQSTNYERGYYDGLVDGRNYENKRVLEMFRMLKAEWEEE